MKKRLSLSGVAVLMAVCAGLLSTYLWVTQVDNTVTADDRRAIEQALGPALERRFPEAISVDALRFTEEIAFIRTVQRGVLEVVPVDAGIPHGMSREPADLLERGKGLCFDRSRFMEKALRRYGFETRHVAIYSTAKTGSALKSLLTPQVRSHAVTEVMTSRGWVVVDSNEPWVSLGKHDQPLSIADIAALDRAEMGKALLTPPRSSIYAEGFTFVYGLYSRHGKFYPPYDVVPDVQLAELLHNTQRLFR
ncbi:transglutaminase domain-containing protein [Halomonas cerina]|uniref:Transglutaminase-like domain-containing protein n=1 Tax=Halomonas cerina TaxID=447424 RepID=A0A839V460_9GAMM|nr:transglutaminase domain-containing protein [Halomonas cerina]MBB3188800.1 hypothetical protein [Halomonas cerina]